MYGLTEDHSIVVIQLEENGGKQVQKFGLHEQAPDKHWQGMASWPANKTDE